MNFQTWIFEFVVENILHIVLQRLYSVLEHFNGIHFSHIRLRIIVLFRWVTLTLVLKLFRLLFIHLHLQNLKKKRKKNIEFLKLNYVDRRSHKVRKKSFYFQNDLQLENIFSRIKKISLKSACMKVSKI